MINITYAGLVMSLKIVLFPPLNSIPYSVML